MADVDKPGNALTKNPLGSSGRAVAENVERLRTKQNLTFAALAKRLEAIGRPIPPLGLRKIVAQTRRVDVDDLVALAIALGVSPVTLLMPDAETIEEAVTVTGNPEPLSAGRAWSWFGGHLPISRERSQVASFVAAQPQWHWRQTREAFEEAVAALELFGDDSTPAMLS